MYIAPTKMIEYRIDDLTFSLNEGNLFKNDLERFTISKVISNVNIPTPVNKGITG
ncbi:hypothetical protein GCM10022389_18210 [Flavobacterium cheonanense]|uniref:Uncharacterized protein n=2 Tax=Flavobacterium TaxID=237 RepID=A0ABP7UYC2_9FLAO